RQATGRVHAADPAGRRAHVEARLLGIVEDDAVDGQLHFPLVTVVEAVLAREQRRLAHRYAERTHGAVELVRAERRARRRGVEAQLLAAAVDRDHAELPRERRGRHLAQRAALELRRRGLEKLLEL